MNNAKLVKKIIKNCRKKKFVPTSINEVMFSEVALKKLEFDSKITQLNIIALGSSHGAYGFIPTKFTQNAFNLCSTSQDLYYSFKIYETISKTNNKISKMFLFFSVFSYGFNLQKTTEKEICSFMKYFYNIDLQEKNDSILEEKLSECHTFFKSFEFTIPDTLGYLSPKYYFTGLTQERVHTHLRESLRQPSQMKYLEDMIKLASKNNHEIIIIIPPVRNDYLTQIPPNTFDRLKQLAQLNNLQVFDLFCSNEFIFDDFIDCDHLNLQGATKLSKILSNFLHPFAD